MHRFCELCSLSTAKFLTNRYSTYSCLRGPSWLSRPRLATTMPLGDTIRGQNKACISGAIRFESAFLAGLGSFRRRRTLMRLGQTLLIRSRSSESGFLPDSACCTVGRIWRLCWGIMHKCAPTAAVRTTEWLRHPEPSRPPPSWRPRRPRPRLPQAGGGHRHRPGPHRHRRCSGRA